MTNKSSKTYNSNSSSNKKKSTGTSNSSVKKKSTPSKKKKEDLDITTRIRVDEDRINDADSLDVSFLGGKSKKMSNSKKEKILNDSSKIFLNFAIIKTLLFGFAFICIITLIVLLVKNNKINFNFLDSYSDDINIEEKNSNKDNVDNEDKKIVEEEKKLDDNYLFVGDFYTSKMNFDDYDFHYVKVSEEKFTTENILDDMKGKIYDYNPSVVFIQVGINDLNKDMSEDDLISNINSIIDGIKDNRPYAKIYIESLYPINKDNSNFNNDFFNDNIDNDLIRSINDKIKSLADEEKVGYIDLYKLLVDEDSLNEDYSDDGIYLNDEGYKVVLGEINKVLDD